ncbi:6243_t:CDS:1, partial [Paraglomus occultum]
HLPKHVIIDIPDSVSSPTRLSPHTRRTLNFLSYFYSSNLLELNSPWWDYNNPLVYRVPWCLNWKKGLSKGVILINSDVSLSHLLYALNGSVVGLIGDAVVDEETAVDACDEDRYNDEKIDATKPVNA